MIDQLLIMISSEEMATIRYRGAESLVAIKQIFVPKPDPAGRAAFYLFNDWPRRSHRWQIGDTHAAGMHVVSESVTMTGNFILGI